MSSTEFFVLRNSLISPITAAVAAATQPKTGMLFIANPTALQAVTADIRNVAKLAFDNAANFTDAAPPATSDLTYCTMPLTALASPTVANLPTAMVALMIFLVKPRFAISPFLMSMAII